MANFYNPKYDTSELIKFTENTVERANFQQIQEALTNKMKEIYGNDIDLTSITADGQWIMARSLLIDKMFSVIVNLQQNLNPATARGTFLDILCSFNNVFRKGQTYSTVQCYVKPINSQIINAYEKTENGKTWQEIKCVDINSKVWTWREYQNLDGSYNTNFNYIPCVATAATGVAIEGVKYYSKSADPVDRSDYTGKMIDTQGYQYTEVTVTTGDSVVGYYTLEKEGEVKNGNVYTSLTFVCEEIGPVNANKGTFIEDGLNESDPNGGDVSKVVDINRYPFKVWEVKDAELGSDTESDESLRTRRELEMSNSSITVLSGLEASLRQIAGVKDVKIINNPSGNDLPTTNINGGDNGVVKPHNVYIILRYENKIDEDNIRKTIGDTIYNKLTPGVSTEKNNGLTLLYGGMESYTISYDLFNQQTVVYWKKCSPQKYPITLNLLINKDYNTSQHYDKICNTIKNYISNISLNNKITISGIINALNTSCIPVNGMNPYIVLNGGINIPCVAHKSTDTTVTGGKNYYERTASTAGAGYLNDGSYVYTVVASPTGNPSTSDYYEVDYDGLDNQQYLENHLSYYDYSEASFSQIAETTDDNYVARTLKITV